MAEMSKNYYMDKTIQSYKTYKSQVQGLDEAEFS